MPMDMPPWTWASARAGLIRLPQSWTLMIRFSVTLHMGISTSCLLYTSTAIDELTPELLRLFIQRIEVGERTEKYSRSSHQSIRIVYRDIGTVDSEMEQGEAQPRIAPPLSEVFQLPA